MSPVLPIDTQRYPSGDYTLEVTAHSSALSQWSDRPVVRQLRFSLWSGQQRLVTGDQQHLVVVSDAVEAYVQTHLTHAAWPQTHCLEILDQQLELTTLQLFDLAEVLSAYGQRQITLPRAAKATSKSKSQTQRPWASSAVASLLVAVGVTTAVYLRDKPAGLNDFATSQAPKSSELEAGDVAIAPPTNPSPETSSDGRSDTRSDARSGGNGIPNERLDSRPGAAPSAELGQIPESPGVTSRSNSDRRQKPQQTEAADLTPTEPNPLDEAASGAAPPLDIANAPDPLAADSFELDSVPEATMPEAASAEAPAAPSPAPRVTAPRATAPAAESARPQAPEADLETDLGTNLGTNLENGSTATASRGADDLAGARRSEALEDRGANGAAGGTVLADIATHLAPYQPTGATYPLVYHLQIAPNGAITTLEPISENAPAIIAPPAINPAPGRSLRVEIIYTGANRPVVNELFD